MFKNLLIASLALLGAGTASAADVQPENVRLVVIWGDDFASGYQSGSEAQLTSPTLVGAGAFFGASGFPNDPRRSWVETSYNNGFTGFDPAVGTLNGGIELGAGIAWMGKRKTGDKVIILNLASPGTDVSVPGFYTDVRWPYLEENDGVMPSLPGDSQVRTDIFDAIAGLDELLPPGSNIDFDGIVFSCWNNGAAAVYANLDNFTASANLGSPARFAVDANDSAQNMCVAIELTIREEFFAAYGTSNVITMSEGAPTLVGLRRPAPDNIWFGSLRRRLEFAQTLYQLNESGPLPLDIIDRSDNLPTEGPSYANRRGVIFVGDSDGLHTLGNRFQEDEVHLKAEATRYVGWQMANVIF